MAADFLFAFTLSQIRLHTTQCYLGEIEARLSSLPACSWRWCPYGRIPEYHQPELTLKRVTWPPGSPEGLDLSLVLGVEGKLIPGLCGLHSLWGVCVSYPFFEGESGSSLRSPWALRGCWFLLSFALYFSNTVCSCFWKLNFYSCKHWGLVTRAVEAIPSLANVTALGTPPKSLNSIFFP